MIELPRHQWGSFYPGSSVLLQHLVHFLAPVAGCRSAGSMVFKQLKARKQAVGSKGYA